MRWDKIYYSYVSSEVTPDSDKTSVVEFGFEVSSFNVGDDLDFRTSDGDFSLISTKLEVKGSLTTDGLDWKDYGLNQNNSLTKRLPLPAYLTVKSLS